jgi:hypothetical protein
VKKSNAALRKPPAVVPVDPSTADTFVNGGGLDVQASGRPAVGDNITNGQAPSVDVQTSRGLDTQTSKRSKPSPSRAVLERADGRTLRRMTVYLPTDLAKRLALHCVERDQDMSAVIAESVARTLKRSDG